MTQPKIKSASLYGWWASPITAELMATSNISLHEVRVNETTGGVYWTESRPQEKGRYAIMERFGTENREVLPKAHSARSMVQELGGGSFELDKNGVIIFSDKLDRNVYRLDPVSEEAVMILQSAPDTCYADFACHPVQDHWIVAIKEDSHEATPETQADDVHNSLVAIDTRTSTEHEIAGGDDFYAYPRFSPDGTHICWVQWSHPDMPWTGTRLYIADWQDGKLTNARKIAGEKLNESISQPRWSPEGTLYFVSDRSGYWQLCSYGEKSPTIRTLYFEGLMKSEFAIADWLLASSTYIFLDANTIAASCVTNATSKVVLLDLSTGSWRDLNLPFVDLALSSTGIFRISDDSLVILGSTKSKPKHLTVISNVRSTTPNFSVVQSPNKEQIPHDYVSSARLLQVPRSSRSGLVQAFLFLPQHPDLQGATGTAPPVLIHAHGGPNGITSPAFDLSIQYWTSRGFAVCSVNYIGSVGHGRQYREELSGHWGSHDIEDIHEVVQYLKQENLVESSKVGIYGGSAGGYCTLSAIHIFPDSFAAAVSSYGISDIQALQADTYKFESHDVERLALSSCRPDDEPGRQRLFKERSPRYHAHKITAPLLILQGTIDKAVPPEQAHIMAAEMRKNGRICKVVEFEGEAHGWVRADTILRAWQEQESWWKKHLCGID